MLESANRQPRRTEPGSLSGCQRARRESHQNQLAVLDCFGQKQVEPALSAGQCGECPISKNLSSYVFRVNTALAIEADIMYKSFSAFHFNPARLFYCRFRLDRRAQY